MFEKLLHELRTDEADREPEMLDPDMARYWSTDRRREQFKNGEITEEQFCQYATKRQVRRLRDELLDNEVRLTEVASAPEFLGATIRIEYNDHGGPVKAEATIYTEQSTERYDGIAGGFGYDKSSSAAADALNKSASVMKALYQYKEDRLKEGLNDTSKETCTGHDNREIIGYGAGYTVLPYFEGAVGLDCYWRIFDKLGFDTHVSPGEMVDYYHVTRKKEAET